MENRILTLAKKAKSIDKLRNILYESGVIEKQPGCKSTSFATENAAEIAVEIAVENAEETFKGLNILILNTPCNGFGDLIFALKLSKILQHYFSVNVKIATTLADSLIRIGDIDNVYKLATEFSAPESNKKMSQCRRYTTLKIFDPFTGNPIDTSNFDLFFDAPLMADYEPSLSNVKKVVPTANKFNTFFFSEYNDNLNKGFDFNMGIGGKRNGMLFLPKPIDIVAKDFIKNILNIYTKFCLIYIADIKKWEKCMFSFIGMILEKYRFRKFTIICPKFTISAINKNIKKIYPFFSNITVIEKKGGNQIQETQFQDLNKNNKNNKKTLIIRGDILPVHNKVILTLMKYSVPDILLTGDQSITDMLMISSRKNIFYQIVDWKRNFAKELAKIMPQKYLQKMSTSCGTMKALKYHGNYSKFVKEWNFMKKSGKKLQAILTVAKMLKDGDPFIKKYTDIVNNSKTLNSALNKLTINSR